MFCIQKKKKYILHMFTKHTQIMKNKLLLKLLLFQTEKDGIMQ